VTSLFCILPQGTSDGTYSYVDPRDGNKVLERTLTEVMKATTGLIGKSVYLILRMKNESRFVGDFFGDEEKEIVLRVKHLVLGNQNYLYKIASKSEQFMAALHN
jgi:hypothetical protein